MVGGERREDRLRSRTSIKAPDSWSVRLRRPPGASGGPSLRWGPVRVPSQVPLSGQRAFVTRTMDACL